MDLIIERGEQLDCLGKSAGGSDPKQDVAERRSVQNSINEAIEDERRLERELAELQAGRERALCAGATASLRRSIG